MLSRLRNLPPLLFRRFHDGIGISFWDHYGGGHGTAVRCHRCHPGLVGIKLVRWEGRGLPDVRAVQLGLWWTVEFSLCAVPHPSHIWRPELANWAGLQSLEWAGPIPMPRSEARGDVILKLVNSALGRPA